MKPSIIGISSIAFLAIVALSVVQTSRAAIVQLRFEGTIGSINENVDVNGNGSVISSNSRTTWGDFSVGEGYTIELAYDTSVAASSGNSGQGWFSNAVTSLKFSLDTGYSSTATVPIAQIFQRNLSYDNFNVFDVNLANHNGEIHDEALGSNNLIQLYDEQGTKVADALVLAENLTPFSDWESALTRIRFGEVLRVNQLGNTISMNKIEINGTINSMTVVPEPSSTMLVGIAGLSAALLRRRKSSP